MIPEQPLPPDDFAPPPEDEAEYDAWFRAQVEAAIAEADDPNCEWIPNEAILQENAILRAELETMIEAQKNTKNNAPDMDRARKPGQELSDSPPRAAECHGRSAPTE
ncbi:hypothetical protein [Massilia sp. NR 4-1]|uniref:hypothetical protein n=1 Tax=Massilia sp. NR 4-1 TaxID=1678028 RepID=UPI00067CDEF1|nr:hypothetical protein [Massilia sp. NR 4-1]AKU21716.1 hypothetical protein ACZ75_09790 [Massilia sp. NR 4-1]